jgi:hypothetical protein
VSKLQQGYLRGQTELPSSTQVSVLVVKIMPVELDLEYYRSVYPDLADHSDAALSDHYRSFGRSEGRSSSSLAHRRGLVNLTESMRDVLEIGPFTTPSLRSPNIKYFDLMSREGLIERASRIGCPTENVPEIDFVSPEGDLTVVEGLFDAAFSSHCIEHQPDLVKHLNDVAALLKPGGSYHLVIPDKRFMFDHFIPESTIADVIEAHSEQRRVHGLGRVIEHRALTTHNDPRRHWAGDHGQPHSAAGIAAIQAAMQEHVNANGGYVDVHAWQFTPSSFRLITQQLHDLGLSLLRPNRVFETPRPEMEFCAIMIRG